MTLRRELLGKLLEIVKLQFSPLAFRNFRPQIADNSNSMLIGEYVVVTDGGEHVMTASSGHPQAGEELILDGIVHVVTRVVHEEAADDLSSRRYTHARIFVTRRARKPVTDSKVLAFADSSGRPWGPGLAGAVFPTELSLLLVAVGYRMQASELKRRRRVAARLLRDGDGWRVERPEELRRLSRLAKRGYGEAASLIQLLAAGVVRAAVNDAAWPSLSIRPPSPRLPSARPALRLA